MECFKLSMAVVKYRLDYFYFKVFEGMKKFRVIFIYERADNRMNKIETENSGG